MQPLRRILLGALFLGITLSAPAADDTLGLDPAALKNWRDMRFGMFVHWGPVSLTGHEIGWSRGRQTPIEKYDQLYKTFNPEQFDADAWVRTAKATGMKYLVITTKHHDGFCIWPSEHTDYDLGESPFKRDPLKELSEACRKQDLKFGTYYSVCDWWHPDFPRGSPGGKTRKPDANLERYQTYLRAQVTELIQNYGPLSTMWFDVPQDTTREQALKNIALVRGLQPDITINSRAGGGVRGDYDTPEQRVGAFNRERPWETCMTICRQWAWKPKDTMKSLEQCVQTLLKTVGGDGNLLFNVGPMPDGRIEPRQVKRLQEMGEWVTRHGEQIYGTRGGPYTPGKWGAATCKGNKINLFIMKWPEEGSLVLPALGRKITGSRALSGGEAAFEETTEGLAITVPESARKPIATVIELTVEGDAFEIEPVKVITKSASVAFGKKAVASNVFQKNVKHYGPDKALDDDETTRWATDAGLSACSLEIDLGQPTEFARVRIDEHEYVRVQKFDLQVKEGETWKTILEGTRIGPKFNQAFDRVTARHVRLNIHEATDGPTLWEFQLLPPGK